jgi:hypothetical protein
MATTQDTKRGMSDRTTEELRMQMFRILDELATARAERASALRAEFDALWKKMPEGEPTIH